MLVVGLTGSIGMGKTTVAARFKFRDIAVFDADAEVHRLYEGSLAEAIETAFPGSTVDGTVDRVRLSQMLVAAPQRFKELEAIVHPAVRARERDFLNDQYRRGAQIAILEIPLLFESGGEQFVDVTVVASAGGKVQRERVLQREGMTPEKLEAILARQVPDDVKRQKADFVVDTSTALETTYAQIDRIIEAMKLLPAVAFEQHWQYPG